MYKAGALAICYEFSRAKIADIIPLAIAAFYPV